MTKCSLTLQITHWVAQRLPTPIMCEFSYRSDDPLAVTLIFDSAGEYPVRWVFARELLADGLIARSGAGEVEIWPVERDGRCSLRIRVGDPGTEHTALFEMSIRPVAQWLDRSYAMVPRDRETADIDWDELTQLLL